MKALIRRFRSLTLILICIISLPYLVNFLFTKNKSSKVINAIEIQNKILVLKVCLKSFFLLDFHFFVFLECRRNYENT